MEKTQQQEYSIEWKKHDDFFVSLNRKLDEISTLGEMCYQDINNLYEYFAKIKNLYNKHKAYIQNPNQMKKDLDTIQTALYDINLMKELKQKKPEAESFRMRIFAKLQEVLTQKVEDITVPELIPKPVKVEREEWENEKDSKKKAMYKTVQLLFENV